MLHPLFSDTRSLQMPPYDTESRPKVTMESFLQRQIVSQYPLAMSGVILLYLLDAKVPLWEALAVVSHSLTSTGLDSPSLVIYWPSNLSVSRSLRARVSIYDAPSHGQSYFVSLQSPAYLFLITNHSPLLKTSLFSPSHSQSPKSFTSLTSSCKSLQRH